MKSSAAFRVLTLILTLTLAFTAACGRKPAPAAETDQQLLEAFTTLLAQDFEVAYLFYGGGVVVSDQGAIQQAGQTYWPSDDPRYPTMGELEALLRATYAGEQERAALLGRTTPGGALLFVEDNKTLYKNQEEWVSLPPTTTREETIRLIARGENSAQFQFEQEGADGSLYEVTLAMVRTPEGWRLAAQLRDAPRTVIREGSAETSLFAPGEAGAVAEKFLEALVARDTAALETLSFAPPGTYASWGSLEVTQARVAQVVEDLDAQGEYLVDLVVTQGGGILEEGAVQYRLKVGTRNAVDWGERGDGFPGLSVDYFQPLALEPYELAEGPEHRHPAAEAVGRLILFFGPQPFETSEQLGAGRITEYVLMDLDNGDDPQPSYTQAQVAAGAKKLFGLEDFIPSPEFYISYYGGFSAGGRGGYQVNKLTFLSPGEAAEMTVTVQLYSDPLQVQRTQTLVYTLVETAENNWQFVSALPQ